MRRLAGRMLLKSTCCEMIVFIGSVLAGELSQLLHAGRRLAEEFGKLSGLANYLILHTIVWAPLNRANDDLLGRVVRSRARARAP